MTSSRAYLIRALNEWILDNDCTPYIVVNATMENVLVPEEHVIDGQIVLNITPSSVRNLLMDNEGVSFDARFNGQPQSLYAPIQAITAIYAKENGQGMVFENEPAPTTPSGSDGSKPAKARLKPVAEKSATSRPQLKVVK
ncbi:MAG: ClpXP protease specificity-enhancing factor [Pseudomonadales bacterium]